jgi:hypothetical protein
VRIVRAVRGGLHQVLHRPGQVLALGAVHIVVAWNYI